MPAENELVGILNAILGHHGADENSTHQWRCCTALHLAAENDQVGPIDALIEAGADTELKGVNGSTPLGTAAIFGHCQSMHALLQRVE